MPDDRPATLGDVAGVRDEIKELRAQGIAVLGQLGEIRIDIAKGGGDTHALSARVMMVGAIAMLLASAILPIVIGKIWPAAPAQIIIQQPVKNLTNP